jgi:two-component system nitrogen regulation response regulator NtrX
VLMMSGHASIQLAVDATRFGARDFIEKPLNYDELLLRIRNTLRLESLTRENLALKREVEKKFEIIGDSPVIRELKERIAVTASSNGRVLITGEHGTGKELVARAIHGLSKRKKAPFIKVNCAAVPTELIESELFGHEKGAFTGAIRTRPGKFEQAHTGTLFLDEIGDMRMEMQVKLLRVLQENEFERVGGSETISVDVRVLAATNQDLGREIEKGRFREDLYYRLNVVPFHVPPLRERREDIPTIAEHFARQAAAENDRRPKRLAPDALAALAAYPWPGNVRELKNIVERLVILVEDDTITAANVRAVLPAGIPGLAGGSVGGGSGSGKSLRDKVSAAERGFLLEALEASGWQIARTARELGLERSHLYKKMRHHGITREGDDTAE